MIAIGSVRPAAPDRPSLFAFPAQSNFSAVRHPLGFVREAQTLGYEVLLDAAAFVPSAALSLRQVPADFVTLSLYKVLGYPTGVGALVARRDALGRLRRPWFAGGTVQFASVQNGIHQLRAGASGFEDGTSNFLGLSAVPRGLAYLNGVGMTSIGRPHATSDGDAAHRPARAAPSRWAPARHHLRTRDLPRARRNGGIQSGG